MNILGYIRVSTDEQAANGYGLASQEAKIREACKQRGWTLLQVLRDEGVSGKSLERPALTHGLELLAAGVADGLIVAKLDRLSRSQLDFALLMQWFLDAGAALVILDPEVDTSSAMGKAIAGVFSVFAEFERDMVSQRTRDGLAARRAQGLPIGRPGVADRPELLEAVRGMREAGLSFREICAALNAERVPTVRGGSVWRPSAIQAVLGEGRRPRRRRTAVLPEIGGRK